MEDFLRGEAIMEVTFVSGNSRGRKGEEDQTKALDGKNEEYSS